MLLHPAPSRAARRGRSPASYLARALHDFAEESGYAFAHCVMSATKVLVVDDERSITDSLVLLLRNSGYLALGAYDAATGLADARLWRPGVVILDLLLPDLKGVEVARKMARGLPGCKIILVSGTPTLPPLPSAAKGFSFLAKPVHPEELLATIASLLQETPQAGRFEEKRRNKRNACDWQAVVVNGKGRKPCFAVAEDLSPRGARIISQSGWKAGDKVEVTLPPPSPPTPARVVYCQRINPRRFVSGVEFTVNDAGSAEPGK